LAEKKINIKSQESFISPDYPALHERIFTKIGINVSLVSLITPVRLCVNLIKDFDFTGGQNFPFPLGNWRRRYNSAGLYRAASEWV